MKAPPPAHRLADSFRYHFHHALYHRQQLDAGATGAAADSHRGELARNVEGLRGAVSNALKALGVGG